MTARAASSTETLSPLAQAIWHTVAYVDTFDYPLTPAEIHRYLEFVPASAAEVDRELVSGSLVPAFLSRAGGSLMLPGREQLVATRQRRMGAARRLWPAAVHFGRLISSLPFVRMLAVTGSLAVNNVTDDADVDYLIVTANGRLWVCRALVVLLVHVAARRGIELCPNYLLTERAVQFADRTLYTAHELAQMVPLSGLDAYAQVRQANEWTRRFLPNAAGPPPLCPGSVAPRRRIQQLAEWPLRTPLGDRLEAWEMARKMRKFAARSGFANESDFNADRCKGHFGGHHQRTMRAYHSRLGHETAEGGMAAAPEQGVTHR